MTLCNLNEIMPDAMKRKYGVLATVLFGFDFADYVIRAAEEKNSPVIIMFSEPLMEKYGYGDFEKLIKPITVLATAASVPVVLHLDHGIELKNIRHAIDCGLTSVMVSRTFKSFEEDIIMAKKVVGIAHPCNVTVEGEVGEMPGEGGLESSKNHKSKIGNIRDGFTKIDEAIKFVNETNVDALSVSVGTAHGFFNQKPEINYELIERIKNAINIPLVIHGASGLTTVQYRNAIKSGIVKLNYLTGLIEVAKRRVIETISDKNDFSFIDLHYEVARAVYDKVCDLIDIFGSADKHKRST